MSPSTDSPRKARRLQPSGQRVSMFSADTFRPLTPTSGLPAPVIEQPADEAPAVRPAEDVDTETPEPKDAATSKPKSKRKPPARRGSSTSAPASYDFAALMGASGSEWGSVGDVDAQFAFDAKRKQLRLFLPEALSTLVDDVRRVWPIRTPQWGTEHGIPGKAAFREGLMRLGLMHIDDPDLFRLIPGDGRRTATIAEKPQVPTGRERTPGSIPELPVDIGYDSGKRLADDGRYPPEFLSHLNTVATSWAFAHPEWLSSNGDVPGAAAFREGLIRLGLKHVNDPRLADVIPVR